MATPAVIARAQVKPARSAWVGALAAGLLVGVAECLLFAFALATPRLEDFLGRLVGFTAREVVPTIGMSLVVMAPLAAGAGFGWLLDRQPDAPARGWRVWLIGPCLLVSSLIGLVVAGTLEPLALRQNDAGRLMVFRLAFT